MEVTDKWNVLLLHPWLVLLLCCHGISILVLNTYKGAAANLLPTALDMSDLPVDKRATRCAIQLLLQDGAFNRSQANVSWI